MSKPEKQTVGSKVELIFTENLSRMQLKAMDISAGGIGVYAYKKIPINHEVRIRICFLNSQGEYYEEVGGTVIWCRTQGFGFAAGIKFNALSPDQNPRLMAFLEQIGPARETLDPLKPSLKSLKD